MIKRLVVISLLAYIFFMLEVMFNDVFGPWFKPELLLLLVVFWGLYSGIRYSIFAAFICGLLRDAYSILPFGTYVFVYVAAAYVTTLVRQNLYQPGSSFSRAVVAFFVLIGSLLIEVLFYLMHHELRWMEFLSGIVLPQVVITMVMVTFVFYRLRDVAVFFKI